MYKGKEVCQGCNKSGLDVRRYSKNELCEKCDEAYTKGKSIIHESEIEYILVYQHYHAFGSLEFNDNTLNNCMTNLLKSINNENAISKGQESIKWAFGDNELRVTIPKKFLIPLQMFGEKMEAYTALIREEKESIPDLARKELRDQKDKIFNDGIEKGKQLLVMLNSGEITLQQLDKNYSYNQNEIKNLKQDFDYN